MKINLQARALAGERKREKTRSALLEAAMRVIADKGAEAASIDAITKAAGLSRGGFYNYFPTLQDLIVAVAAEVSANLDREIDVSMAEVEDPCARLALAMLRFIEVGAEDPVWGWVFLRLDSTPLPSVGRARERFRREYEAGVAAGRFREVSLYAGYSLTAGSIRMCVRAILSGAPRTCAEETVQLVLIGLGLDEAEARRLCRPADR